MSEASLGASDRSLVELVAAAGRGDGTAWDLLVERYAGLVVAIARSFRLSEADVADVSQTVWLRLVESLGTLREPQALPGWLGTSARRECLAVLRRLRRERPTDQLDEPETGLDAETAPPDTRLLREEQALALRLAFAELPEHCRDLLSLLLTDPPTSYSEISDLLGVSKGCVGPNRSRCLDRLRNSPALVAYVANHPLPRERRTL